MKDVCSICDPFNCDCVCARCGDPATTEVDDGGEIVSLCAIDCCPAQDGEPCSPPCASCQATEDAYRREWEQYGRREVASRYTEDEIMDAYSDPTERAKRDRLLEFVERRDGCEKIRSRATMPEVTQPSEAAMLAARSLQLSKTTLSLVRSVLETHYVERAIAAIIDAALTARSAEKDAQIQALMSTRAATFQRGAEAMRKAILMRLWKIQGDRAVDEKPEETMKIDALLSTIAAVLDTVEVAQGLVQDIQ